MPHFPTHLFRAKTRFHVRDLVLWSVVDVFALLLVCVGNHIGQLIGISLASLTCLGVFLRWGPVVPCMFLGMGIFSVLTCPVSSSHEEAAFKLLGVPAIGAICGAIVGFLLERRRPCPTQADVDGEPDGAARP